MADNLKKVKVSVNRRKFFAGLAICFSLTAGLIMLQGPEIESNNSEFNRQDIMFMNMMIVHHDQAIEMAELAENRTDNENILSLSKNISTAQKAENKQMTQWMQNMGYEPGNHHPMAGMATEEEMQRLEQSGGKEFDKLFSELMIEHHRGGIEMAKNFRKVGQHSELKQMQKEMIETQQKEISKMQDWQNQGF